jgi:hypothetical protein
MTHKQINQILQAKNIPLLNDMLQVIKWHDDRIRALEIKADKPGLLQQIKAKFKPSTNKPGQIKT